MTTLYMSTQAGCAGGVNTNPCMSPTCSVSRVQQPYAAAPKSVPYQEACGIPCVPAGADFREIKIPPGMLFAGVTEEPVLRVEGSKKAVPLLVERLQLLYTWYKGMISHSHGRLEYSYSPVGDPEPPVCVIRDMGAVWELELLSHFLDEVEINDVIEHSLDFFCKGVTPLGDGEGIIMDPRFIGEPSTVAHSAMLLLALLWDNVRRETSLPRLAAVGILRQQRPDGSYKVHFADMDDGPMWMYGCEALCALAEAYRWLRDARFAQSADKALRFYDNRVFVPGLVDPQLLPFFFSWQCHACRLLFDAAGEADVWGFAPASSTQHRFADYAYRMADRLVGEGFFEDLTRVPQVTCVAIAASIEGLNDAYAMAKVLRDDRTETYEKCIRTGLLYLMGLQCVRGYGRPEKERGGFALTPLLRNQRVDFSGPAARAFMKTLTNGIKPPMPVV